MTVGDWLALLVWQGLALVGCAYLMRRVARRIACCPAVMRMCRVAIPYPGVAAEPLLRCLQAQADGGAPLVLLLPEEDDGFCEEVRRCAAETPGVRIMTFEEARGMTKKISER